MKTQNLTKGFIAIVAALFVMNSPALGQWTLSGNKVYTTNNAYQVGIGTGATMSAYKKLEVKETYSIDVPTYGIYVDIKNTDGDDTDVYGTYILARTDDGNGDGNVYGTFIKAISTHESGDVCGGYFETAANSNNYHCYGLYVNAGTTGPGYHYGIYVEGGKRNYFEKPVGIGTTNPSAKLEVSGGDLEVTTGDIRIDNGESSKIWHSSHNLTLENQNGNHHYVNIQPGTYSGNVYSILNLKSRPNGTDLETRIKLHTNGNSYFNGGNVGIGTTNPQSKLAVNGTITAKEVEVTLTGWPDHVFAESYRLMPLDEVETYIKEHNHLPDIPSAAEVEGDGVALGDMQARLLQKIEELTLYVIDLQKENKALKRRVAELEIR